MTEFRYLSAADWGMRWARPPIAEKMPDPELYVHHSAGAHVNDAVAAFRALNEYAINTKGYSALDYDVLVHRDKLSGLVTIGEGRGKWMSAATLDRNEQGEAVCLLGYFHPGNTLSRQPHPDELEGVALAIVWGMEQGWISPTASILGHRDNPAHPGATSCPGDYLQAQLPTIRARVDELLKPPPGDDMQLTTLEPALRLMDTRPLPSKIDPDVEIEVATGLPNRSVFVNVTAVDTDGPGFLIVWGRGPKPSTSNVNYDGAGQIRANLALVTTDADGKIRFSPGSSATDVIVDLQGYVA